MKRAFIAGAIALGVGLFARTLAQPPWMPETSRGDSATSEHAASLPSDRARPDDALLHARVAQLRAEVEALQIEHDVARERFSAGLAQRAGKMEDDRGLLDARDYMRIGAELVGKGSEFESALQDKSDEITRVLETNPGTLATDELDRRRQDLVRLATELNAKKIELIGLEVHLDGSM